MTDIKKYQGIIPAFYACYDAEGNVNPAAVQELTQWFIEGCPGPVRRRFLRRVHLPERC